MSEDDEDPPAPNGVTLADPDDSTSLRGSIEKGMLDAMGRYIHGYEYGGVRLEVKNLHLADRASYSKAEQKEALQTDRMMARRIRGDVSLIDVETNKPLDVKKKITLARLPYLTERGTFINNGSEFSPIMQSRLLPGAYTRRRDNGELETHLNVRAGTGASMRVTLEPTTGVYRLKVGSSDVHAYSVFKDLGVSDEELERRWGAKILDINRTGYSKDALDRVYNKAIPRWQRDATLDKVGRAAAVTDAFNRVQVAESILKENLPNLYNQKQARVWRTTGVALEMAQVLEKSAAMDFSPDMTPDQMIDDWQLFDFDLQVAMSKQAGFDPDLTPDDMRESYNTIYGSQGPRLASMAQWPEHWLDDQDKQGWLQWYEAYSSGRRSEQDDRQIERWKSFKRRHGGPFIKQPTPRRAYALRNWGIDATKMLPEEQQQEFSGEMEAYRRKAYMKWFMNRPDFDEHRAEELASKLKSRGVEVEDTKHGTLMRLALDGHITPKDLA